MCNRCGPETIWHIEGGQRTVDREWCFCACHDSDEGGRVVAGIERDDELGAATACPRCQWAHAVAYSTADWRNDERCMVGPLTSHKEPLD